MEITKPLKSRKFKNLGIDLAPQSMDNEILMKLDGNMYNMGIFIP